MKHKHADLMLEYAKQAQVSEEPWRNWEVSYEGEGVWFDISVQPSWDINKEFRMKKKTIKLAETYLWPDINKVDFSKCQRCHKRKSPIYDKRYKSSISSICKKCLKEFYG